MMAVDIIRKKNLSGDFDIHDFETYLRAIKELASQDPDIEEILQEIPDFTIQFSIYGITDIYFQVNNNQINIENGVAENAEIKFEMTDVVGSGIIRNEIDPVSAYLSGDFKITGEAALAMKLKPFIEKYKQDLGFKENK
jgi:putative sterol carrier protein